MKKILCALLVLVMLFAFVGCESEPSNEIVKDKKLSVSNAQTYLDIDVNIENISTLYSPYDGEEAEYAGGRWRWATAKAVITISSKSANEVDFKDCKFTLDVDYGTPFKAEKIEVVLDEEGKWTKEVSLTSEKVAVSKDGYAIADYVKPVPTYTLDDVSGSMEIHIQLDENGSVVTNTEEE